MRWTRSFFRVALNDSAQALSQHTPVRPTEGRILWCSRCRANCCEVYWLPRSEWKIVTFFWWGQRRTAISMASQTRSVLMLSAMA